MKLSKSPGQTCIAFRLGLCLLALVFSLTFAQGQELAKNSTAKAPDEPVETNVSERVRLLETELERQNAKLDQLQKTIADQQSAIQALLEKLSVKSAAVVATDAPVANSTSVVTSAPAAPQPQTPTVEQRVAKLENQSLRIGPLKLS